MNRHPTLDAKDPAEVLVLTWDYSAALEVGETLTAATTSASLLAGPGGSPLALAGLPAISGGEVRQAVSGGADGDSYTVRCLATLSSGRLLALAGTLPVRPA